MRIRVQHDITCAYETPIPSLIQMLRLTPRNHDGQIVRSWQIDVDADATLKAREDSFGNTLQMLTLAGPIASITMTVEGEVETQDTNGILTGAQEPFPARLYLRETTFTHPGAGLANFATETAGKGAALDRLHALMSAIHEQVDLDLAQPSHAMTTAAEAFVLRQGTCHDVAHVFIAGARSLGIPARFISGYMVGTEEECRRDCGHSWAEAFVDGLGWVGFDAANCICTTEAYVRVAVGLDYLGAAPVRGVSVGVAKEKRTVTVDVAQVHLQARAQRQS